MFLIVVEWFLIVIACFSKAKTKANLYQIKNFTLFKKAAFFINIFLKNCKKTGPQRVPPCRSLHLQLKTGISTCNKKQPSWLWQAFFSLLPIRIQWRSHQSPSEKRGFVKTLQKPLGKSWDFRFTIAKQTPPLKKKIGGGPSFTIVHPPLYW